METLGQPRAIMMWKIFQSTRDRATSLDAILFILPDCKRTWSCASLELNNRNGGRESTGDSLLRRESGGLRCGHKSVAMDLDVGARGPCRPRRNAGPGFGERVQLAQIHADLKLGPVTIRQNRQNRDKRCGAVVRQLN